MKTFALSILLSISISGWGQVSGVIKNYKHISKNDGIASNNVTTISDDVFGRIWIGTAQGLDIYDSNNLKKPEGYSGLSVSSLFNTGKEMLIGTSEFTEAYNYDSGTYSRVQYEGKDIGYALSVFRFRDKIIILAGETVYRYEKNHLEIVKSKVPYRSLNIDKFGILWGLNKDVVYKINEDFHIVKSYRLKSPDLSPLIGLCLFPDSKGCVWIGTVKDGLFRYNRATDHFYKENLVSMFKINEIENIGSINEDKYDRLWIGHNSGLSVYDYNNSFFKNYMFENSNNITLNTTITYIYKTRDLNMVLGTFFTGFFYVNELDSGIKFYNLAGFRRETGGVTANGIVKDHQGRLWVATNCMGIGLFDKNARIIKQINHNNEGISDNTLSLELDEEGNIWAGALSSGLYKITMNGQVTHFINHPNDKTSLSGSCVYDLYSVNGDSLLVASNKGVDVYRYRNNTFSNILSCGNEDYAFCNILPFRNNIFIINFNSLFCFNRTTKAIKEYNLRKYKNVYIQCAYIDKAGQLWLGTKKGDLFLFRDGHLMPYLVGNTLINSSISGIQGDMGGNLWLSSGNNLFCITPSKEIRKFNLSWGLGKNEFNIRSNYTDSEGFIYFGTSDGLLGFNPKQINIRENKVPALYISDFKLFKNPVKIGGSSILQKQINNTNKIVLENKQNFISFEVASIDYNTNRTTPYKCMYNLEGFDNNWYEVNTASNEISFTGLTTGKYILHVKLQADNGKVLASKSIEIKVKPPFLLNSYMIFLYLIILTMLVRLVRSFLKRQKMSRELVEQTKREQAEITKLNALKLDFFTYISHEFKTPLAIISTLQEEILPLNKDQDSDAEIFKRNVKRLEFLINQLMDFRNIESQYARADIKKHDLIPFIKGIYEAFVPLYKNKEITSQFITEIDELPILFDSEKIEMLVGNLLSNTFKHTSPGGKCYVKIFKQGDHVVVDVFNSGACLTDEQKMAIFQPYYRTNTSSLYSNSGIGLAIVNSLAKLLNIKLSVVCIENEGNVFRAEMPIIQDDNLKVSSLNTHTNIVDRIVDNTMYIEEQAYSQNNNEEGKNGFQILLVENDADTKKILKKKLQEHFHVLIASNGSEALLLMKSQNADVVISDIMMPETDGYELCKKIKENSKTRHVPVILITSDLSAESKIRGFQSGADAFLQKPINIQELFLRLDNILKNKNILRSYYSNLNLPDVGKQEVNNADEEFIREMTEYVYDHLADTELSVHQLARHVNVSRTQLYLNIKRLTDQTPSSFVLNIKMAQAKKMLLTTSMTSSEISYKLGYCSPNHFSRQFKDFYKLSPSEFRKQ